MILRLAVGWTVLALGCLILPVLVSLVQANSTGRDVERRRHIDLGRNHHAARRGCRVARQDLAIGQRRSPRSRQSWTVYEPFCLRRSASLFAACLLVVFGGVLNFVLAQLQVSIGQALALGAVVDQPKWLPLVLQLLVAAILLIGVMTFRHVNVNRFSMHAVYRNRLTRAFLGSARNRREQDPFTGFDPQDNTPLSSLLHNANSLFPVINTTLNITAGNNTAWAERQAASFTATPLACGSAALRHPTAAADRNRSARRLRPHQSALPAWRP